MGKYDMLAGMKIGSWSVLERSNRSSKDGVPYWRCKCECGTEREVLESSLVRGRSKSCGCSRKGKFKCKVSREDKDPLMIGKRFGLWTIESRAEDYALSTGERYDQWNCVCDCGTRRVVLGSNLLQGRSLSCGCYKASFLKRRGKELRLTPKYRTISKLPSIKEMVNIVLGETNSINDFAIRQALIEMFPYYWQAKVREEQTIMRRYGSKEHMVCENCGKHGKLEMHHIIPVVDFGGNEPENIMWLCHDCHAKIGGEQERKKSA